MSPKLSSSFAKFSLFVFLAAAPALPQCDYKFQYSGEYRASILDLSLLNNDLWAATGYGIQLFDRSVDPPRLIGSVGIPGLTTVVRASGSFAYAGGTNGVAVVLRSGNALQVVRTIPLAAVNDIAFDSNTVWVATSSGIISFDRLTFAILPATFPTSSPAVTSLALSGSTLYAADGDNTIEVFSVGSGTAPVKAGTVSSALRATSVESTGSRLYASDGIRTEVFTGTGAALTSIGTLPYPSRSVVDLGSNVVMIAGSDRQMRAIDATVPENYIELFDGELFPNGGTINRVNALQLAAGRLYAAGGDMGLATYDVSHFAAPFPVLAYAIGPTTSIVTTPTAFYASLAGGGIQEMTRSSNGSLTIARVWDTTERPTLQDSGNGFLLTSSGAKATFWTLASGNPSSLATATFAAPVHTARLNGTTAIVLLQDGTLWTADMSQVAPAPVRVASTFNSLVQLAHSSAGNAATTVAADGATTTIRFWNGNDLNAAPANVTVPGAATSLALSGRTAAVFTFRGITVVDFATSTQRLVTGSNDAITTALDISGGDLVALTQSGTVRVWDLASGKLLKQYEVPGDAIAIDALQESSTVGVASSTGVATIDYGTSTSQPGLVARTSGNTYYKKAVAGGQHLYIFDGRMVDIYNIKSTIAPTWSASVFAPGVIDIAASESALFTLSNNDVVTEYSSAGVQLRSQPLSEGTDVTPIAITTVSGVPWISFSRGCTTTGCEKQTDVLDPQSLIRTASLPGGAVDATAIGLYAYAVFDLPAEIRVYAVGDPLHPSMLATRPNDAGAVAVSASAGTVYALAERIYAYTQSMLAPAGTQLTPQKPGAFADLIVDTTCATIAGRSPAAEVYAVPQWTAVKTMAVPGSIRSAVLTSGRLIFLTDYSIEIWSRDAAPVPPKRRAVTP